MSASNNFEEPMIQDLINNDAKLLSVKRDTALKEAITLMILHDYSQLPVLQSNRDVKGYIDWKSIGEKHILGGKTETVAEQVPETQIAPEQAEEDVESGDLNTKITGKAKHEICPDCGTKTQIEEGCVSCKACGWALCK